MPFVLLAVVSDVTTRAKEFATLSPTEILLALNDAAAEINTGEQNNTTITIRLQATLAAHLLSIRNPTLALPAGPTTSNKVGDVAQSYAVTPSPAREDDLNASRWGREFIRLRRQDFKGRLNVL